MSEFSFLKGLSQVQAKDLKSVKHEIMTALEINSRSSWRIRLNGKVEPKITEAKSIEAIFAKRGITDVWGEALTSDSSEK
jgi:hypothetical protein